MADVLADVLARQQANADLAQRLAEPSAFGGDMGALSDDQDRNGQSGLQHQTPYLPAQDRHRMTG
jgi:hypothetical protein